MRSLLERRGSGHIFVGRRHVCCGKDGDDGDLRLKSKLMLLENELSPFIVVMKKREAFANWLKKLKLVQGFRGQREVFWGKQTGIAKEKEAVAE